MDTAPCVTQSPNLRAHPRKASALLIVGGVMWFAVALIGTAAMLRYSNTPSRPGTPASGWPETSSVPRLADSATLVMFVHPYCACSRASIGELAQLMAHQAGRVDAHVLFLDHEEIATSWAESELWRTATAIPGVSVMPDAAGREAELFHSTTSGDTLLYDGAGCLLFHGGITLARGHAGDNPGRTAIEALLNHRVPRTVATPVFGCGLFDTAKAHLAAWNQ